MASRVHTSLTLFGSPPWGFRLSGGKEFNQPLVITRVTPGSISAKSGLTAGDVLISVNGQFVNEMTQDECEAKVKQAVGSLYLVVEKNAASVSVQPSGEVTVQGDRGIYNDEVSELERLSRHNRSAKPFPGSFTTSNNSVTAPSINTEQKSPNRPAGFRSVIFRPKETTQSPTSPNGAVPTSRGQPDGGSTVAPTYNNKPRHFVASPTADDLPPPPADFIEPQPSTTQAYKSVSPSSKPEAIRVVLGPNQAIGLYSNSNAQLSYQAQVGGK
ncbi:PDZ and LIM domain protein 1-like isoform X1 [Clavelina lepadiformis]|uniref:PDZ and LIM domain protein 1-like isoform X1 n=1 Tax=Clavelina lepadiformis TaxID=159417 RepID=UPI0040426D8D